MRHFALLVVAALSCSAAEATKLRSRSKAKWWPFGAAATTTTPMATMPPAPPAPMLADVKDAVMLSGTFGKKTEQLCHKASEEDMKKCRQVAGERLFCALLARHSEQYQGYQGIEEAEQSCKEVDPMMTAAEAAKEARLDDMAADAF
eukprot:TRINITY_DN25707_c0_g1_i1.p2 TRINITY_DN25707_c0_g1~~TRINITY_DN25707_c0_g1_i1.p2  ORF type:complete len:147 (-),score=57.40 TRINITY_DN25707_c0_g1_i1:176-616(-)